MSLRVSLFAALSLAVVTPGRGAAQQPDNTWRFTLAPYFVFPHMDGTVAIGPVQTELDASPGDIFSNLQFGAMLAAEAGNNDWAIGFDGVYMDLGKDGAKAAFEYGGYQAMIELTGFRKLTPFFEVLLGGRVNMMGGSVKSPLGVELADADKAWFDPFLGARFILPNTGKWKVMLRGDVGGFGVGSQFAWQVRPTVAYSVSKHWSFGLAYWAVGMDYATGELGERNYFKYDVTTFGPELGVGYTF